MIEVFSDPGQNQHHDPEMHQQPSLDSAEIGMNPIKPASASVPPINRPSGCV